jgi:parallel beta-helix repeat protein
VRVSLRAAVAFTALLAVMTFHQAEHVVQVWQKDVVGAPCPNDCRGLLGFAFDVEWIHYAYNFSIFLALGALVFGFGLARVPWLAGGLILQGYHVIEHVEKLAQWFANGGHSPTPGLLGMHVSLVELHFAFNTAVFVLVLSGYVAVGAHRRLWEARTPGRVATAAALLTLATAGTAAAWTQRPPTVRLAAGVHPGPLVLDRAQRLVGEPGAVVRGGIVVTADDVVVRDLAVLGGENGIEVRDAENVLLQRVRVTGAAMDGISARRSSVTIRGCAVHTARAGGQGIDISFAMALPPSRVARCTVTGGSEGIVSHLARVRIEDNRVSGTALRGIAVTEMSTGTVTDNVVSDALGVGIFCGDYSHCEIEANDIGSVRPDRASGNPTRNGFGIVSHFGAVATLRANRLDGGVAAFIGGRVEHD